MTIPIIRKRVKHVKKKTGCRTCRARHIKCDEARPSCNRCTKSGRHCDGYDTPSPGSLSSCSILLPRPTICSPMDFALSVSPFRLTVQEQSAFDFFCAQTVHQLPGSSWTLAWERIALHASHWDSAVAHSVAALGGIHRSLVCEDLDQCVEHYQFALGQYNKAMNHLYERLERLRGGEAKENLEVVLLVSLLFFCFEVLQGEEQRAVIHLHEGLRILYAHVQHHNPTTDSRKRTVQLKTKTQTTMDALVQTFVRLDCDVLLEQFDHAYLYAVCTEEIPSTFLSFEESAVHLDAITSAISIALRDLEAAATEALESQMDLSDLEHGHKMCLISTFGRFRYLDAATELAARFRAITARLTQWKAAMSQLFANPQHDSAYLQIYMHFSLLYFTSISLWFKDEFEFDAYEEQFEHHVDLAEQWISLNTDVSSPYSLTLSRSREGTRPGLTLGTSVLPALFLVVQRCRCSSLRRRSIRVIESINMKGVFDSAYCLSVLRKVIDIEEDAARLLTNQPDKTDWLSAEIPRAARLSDIYVSHCCNPREFYKSDTGCLSYSIDPVGPPTDWVVHTMTFPIDRSDPGMETPLLPDQALSWDTAR